MQPILSSVLLQGLGSLPGDPNILAVATDSRAVRPGSLFVCIRGERADGHAFAAKALEAGAAGIVAQHPIPGIDPDRKSVV